jgi:hypothetical protein
MKRLRKKKLDSTEWYKNIMKKVNYNKFIKSTVLERRKQKNINNG